MNLGIGDLIFTRWPAWDSRLTETVSGGRCAHVEQIREGGEHPKVIAASRAMNRMNTWTWESRKAYFQRTATEYMVIRLKTPLRPDQASVLTAYFEEAENSFDYSKGELFLQLLDGIKNKLTRTPYDSPKAVYFRRLGNMVKQSVICSHVVAIGMIRLGMLPKHAEFWSPADLFKWASACGRFSVYEVSPGFYGKPVKKEG